MIDRDEKTGRFLTGNNGSGGRPKGSRNKLATKFTDDLLADWESGGIEALVRAREDDPAGYVRIVASILPKENITRHQPGEDMTEDELRDAIAEIRDFLAIADPGGEGPSVAVTSH